MRFDRIRLENFKCYEEADLILDPGVTVIHGLNGSGKSSLLEACFFALYGSKALDRTLDEVVTIGAEETTVELWFGHAGESYHIERRVRMRDGTARTVTCVLEEPDGVREGATDVRARIADLLRMDTDAFVNCAYVRQGEVNKLINASPADRQDMLDDLLQLGKLEKYRERASDARVGVGRVRDDTQGALAEVENQIEAKEERNLYERRNDLATELSEAEEEVQRYEENRDRARETREQASAVLEEYEEKRERIEQLRTGIDELRETIRETEQERERLGERLRDRRERRESVRERRAELLATFDDWEGEGEGEGTREQVSEATETVRAGIESVTEELRELSVEKQEEDGHRETLLDQAEQLEATATENREEADELETELNERREKLDEQRGTVQELDEEIQTRRREFEDAPIGVGEATRHREAVADELGELRETQAQRRATLETAREQLQDAESLLAAGKCPECGQPVENSPHVDAIEEHRERVERLESAVEKLEERGDRLESRLETAEEYRTLEEEIEERETEREKLRELLEERERSLSETESRIETLREEAADLEADAEEKRETAEAAMERAQDKQEAIAECNERKQTLEDRRDRLAELDDVLDRIDDLTDEIERLGEQREEKASHNEERRERLQDEREQLARLEASFDEEQVEQAREKKEEAESYLEEVDAKLESLEDRRSDLQARLGGVTNEIEALEELRERREDLSETVEHLESLYEETEQLEETYGQLRAELRRRNVESLERMLNETFELVYQNDTYSNIELDSEYRLTVYQKDGETLDPDQLSGGERALFNLSLRCGIYRLLAEGIEGTAPMPPLILDEPTVFLDSGHVSQLVELVDAMRELGVEQILVVSHDEELVAAADALVRVRKDATTNRSSIETADTVEERMLADADD